MKKSVLLFAIFITQIFCASIPCLDLAHYYDADKRASFLKKVNEALIEYGFFSVINTNINHELTDATYNLSQQFFSKSLQEKMLYSGINTNCQRGYVPFGCETAKGKVLADFKEFFHVGLELDVEQAALLKYWQNIWPQDIKFKKGFSDFRDHLLDFSVVIEEILAQSLGLEKSFFSKKTQLGDTVLRLIHYPKYEMVDHQESFWASEHTDIDLFTILPVATSEGLEVKTRSGEWIRAKTPKSAFIVNAGDFLEIFTNGLYQSSVHRVRKCTDNFNKDRYSMVMFVHPRADVILNPIASCVEKTGGRVKFATATRYEMLMERLTDLGQATDQMLKDLRDSKIMERLIKVGRASPDALIALRKKGYASKEVIEELSRLGL